MIAVPRPIRLQSGAALVVGLILLLAISLLAIANINTDSIELIATSNEQFNERAFQSAEAAIERAMVNNAAFNSASDFSLPAVTTGNGNDTFRYVVTRPTGGIADPPPPGNSETTFSSIYFKITATGHSEGGATAENTQELYQLAHAADSSAYNSTACLSTTSLDGAQSTC